MSERREPTTVNRLALKMFSSLLLPELDRSQFVGIGSFSTYPYLVIYRPIYPHFDLYPSKALEDGVKCFCQRPSEPQPRKTVTSQKVSLRRDYPNVQIYSSIYPYSIYDIYPVVNSIRPIRETTSSIHHYAKSRIQVVAKNSKKSIESPVQIQDFPVFDLYPATYPSFDIYPSVKPVNPDMNSDTGFDTDKFSVTHNLTEVPNADVSTTLSVRFQSYPFFDLYPAIYPLIEVYPPIFQPAICTLRHLRKEAMVVSPCDLQVPVFSANTLSIKIQAHYPAFNLYPIFPQAKTPAKLKSRNRLTHAELHAMVMVEKMGIQSPMPPLISGGDSDMMSPLKLKIFTR